MSKENHEQDAVYKSRHSLSHVLAQAIQRALDPIAKLGIGPAIDTGFYYDFIFSEGVECKEDQLKEINKMMVKIVKETQNFDRIELTYDQAKEIILMLGEEFKIELLDEFKAQGEKIFSYYVNSIPMAAKDNLLRGSQEGYFTKYGKINDYLNAHKSFKKTIADRYVTFIDMCE